MVAVSIVLPVFNRKGTLVRAVQSVCAQHFRDWELLVVDDGSTDGGCDDIAALDARIRVVKQTNAGASAARNHGIRIAQGRYVAFIDSDDEWLPHFLSLTVEFLERNPSDAFVATEFIECTPSGPRVQDRTVIAESYVPLAKRIGSHSLDRPAALDDEYLRIYSSRELLPAWCEPIVHGAPEVQMPIRCYRGSIGEAYRWGHLHALWCILFRRATIDAIGPIAEDRRNCADLKFLVDLCRKFPAVMIAVPSVLKHELTAEQRKTSAGHLSWAATSFQVNQTALFEELFVRERPDDGEIGRLYARLCLRTAVALLAQGQRLQALEYLGAAKRHGGDSGAVTVCRWAAKYLPSTRASGYLGRLALALST